MKKGRRSIVDWTKKAMKLNRNVPYSEIAELCIFREALREVGSK